MSQRHADAGSSGDEYDSDVREDLCRWSINSETNCDS